LRGARYDAFGNIIILAVEASGGKKPFPAREDPTVPHTHATPKKEKPGAHGELINWNTTDVAKRINSSVKEVLSDSLEEGRRQFSSTVEEAKQEVKITKENIRSLPKRFHGSVRSFWKRMNKPVFACDSGKKKKTPTKTKLFLVDTVRFGGTFAGIFIVLFVGINYQSFWQIAKAQLALGGEIKTEQALKDMIGGFEGAAPRISGTISNRSDARSQVQYLPAAGPFENRLIIPKIGKNIPIVRPGMEALMKEDWKKFEADIQTALRGGAVHYPGSARPGQAGNFFVTAHSSYYPWDDGKYKDSFARLGDLEPGDTYMVYFNGDKHTYRVTGKKEVSPNNVTVLDQPTNKRLATLMTCTPVGTTLRRLIVTAEEIDPVSGEILKIGQHPDELPEKNLFSGIEVLPI